METEGTTNEPEGAPATGSEGGPSTGRTSLPELSAGQDAPAAQGGRDARAPGITPEEVEQRAYAATQKAIADDRAAQAKALAEAQAKQIEDQRRASGQTNPAQDAMEAIDLRTDLYDEAVSLHPDMPQDIRDRLKTELRQFKTVDALRTIKSAGLHRKLADAAMGEAVRTGKYSPGGVRAPSREPVGDQGARESGSQGTRVPDGYRRAVAELGLTDDELQSAYALDRARF